jgi:hypothetical protein
MSFKDGLIKARSHLILLLGLVVAFGIVIKLESWDPAPRRGLQIDHSTGVPHPSRSPLTAEEQLWARVAWRYFENNYEPATGLVNSVDGYPASTMWDTASYLMAIITAYRLAIIRQEEFDRKLSQVLTSLAKMPLFADALPNKSYNTRSLEMVNYNNEKSQRGIGWSAIDIGRLLVPFNIIVWHYPQHTPAIKAIVHRWKFGEMVRSGVLYGTTINAEGETIYGQEGRIGYEEYAAKSLSMLGLDVSRALKYEDFLRFVEVYGIKIPTDSRDPARYHAHNYVVSEPYILDGVEFGWDQTSRELAFRVYRAQEERFKHTGVPTAVSEDNIDQPPYFVYNTVFTGGKVWGTISETGADASAFKTLSTKAAFGWHALYKTPYTQRLLDRIKGLYDADRGWYSGLYEQTQLANRAITANTNAIILESFCYQRFGPLVGFSRGNEGLGGADAAEAAERFGRTH